MFLMKAIDWSLDSHSDSLSIISCIHNCLRYKQRESRLTLVAVFVLIMSKFELTSKSKSRLFVELMQSEQKPILNIWNICIIYEHRSLWHSSNECVRTGRFLDHHVTKYRVFEWREIVLKYGRSMRTAEKELYGIQASPVVRNTMRDV